MPVPTKVDNGHTLKYVISTYTNRREEQTNGITANGEPTVEGRTISCPPQLKLGTKVQINELDHIYTCTDRGGAIRGNRIDLFMEDLQKALNFGMREMTITIVGE